MRAARVGLRPRDSARAAWALLAFVITLDEARGRADEPSAQPAVPAAGAVTPLPALTPPVWLSPAPPKHLGLAPRELRLSFDLGVTYLRFVVHGDYKPGFAPFLGTSTAAIGGLRLRF